MKERSDLVSKEALGLDYLAASVRYDEMKSQIKVFNERMSSKKKKYWHLRNN